MAKITSGATFGLNAKQATAARLLAEGKTEDDVILIIFGGVVDPQTGEARAMTPAEKGQATKTLRKWSRLPGFADCYRSIVKEIALPSYGKAVAKITEQIDNPNPWVAQGAAREVLTRFGPVVMGSEDHEIVVRVEGAPLLGMPSAETIAEDAGGTDAERTG